MAKGWLIEGITPEQPLAERARLIIVTKFREAFHHREGVINSEDPELIHDMRVSLRRLWAALRGFQDCFRDQKRFSRLAGRTRKLARKLGGVRDLDVQIILLQKQRTRKLSDNASAALDNTIEYCLQRRARARAKLLSYLDKLAVREFEGKFLGFFEDTSHNTESDKAPNIFLNALTDFYAHAPDLFHIELNSNDHDSAQAEMLHQLRIAAKKLRYSLEFFEICYRQPLTNYVAALRALQDLLGDIHDCDVMLELLARRQKKEAADNVLAIQLGYHELITLFHNNRTELRKKFRALWQRRFQQSYRLRLTKILDQADARHNASPPRAKHTESAH